jgi:hypothetical protein
MGAMAKRHEVREMKRAREKQVQEARFFFLSMQAREVHKRFALAWRLFWRTDLKRQARRDGVKMRDLRLKGVVKGVL